MRTYRQLTPGERYELSALRRQGFSQAEIARSLGRHRSTISREVRRNSRDGTGRIYRPGIASEYACWRRARSRRNQRLATHLNNRPRKRLDYLTPAECYEPSST